MNPPALDWDKLATYASTPFPPNWDANSYVFFSPRDPGVHDAIIDVLSAATHRVVVNMYGYDDEDVDRVLHGKAASPEIAFFMNLDSSQAGGAHEKALLAPWASAMGTSVAVGRSAKHAISHLKVGVVDSLYLIAGSTNWSRAGEQSQDNELTIRRDPLLAARYESILLINHAEMLRQMAAKQGA